MGQIPAKMFPWPTPYGQSPDSNVLSTATAAAPAPQLTLQSLQGAGDPQSPTQMQAQPQAAQAQPQAAQTQWQNPYPGSIRRLYAKHNNSF